MRDYGPQHAADFPNTGQTVNPLDISAMKMIAEAKSFTPTYYHQLCRPALTNPYKVAETAEKILLLLIEHPEPVDPMHIQSESEMVKFAAKRAMDMARALHAEFTKYEDEIEREAFTKAHEEQTKQINKLYKSEST